MMADNKKNQIIADEQKASSIAPETPAAPVADVKKKVRKAPKIKKPKKKGIPLVVDILIVVLLLAVVAAAVYGLYSLGKYFSTRYAQMEITYTLLLRDVDAELVLDQEGECVVLPDSDVYLAEQEGTHEIGQVLSTAVDLDENGGADVYVVVRTTADYNYTLGYFVKDTKIAVGKEYLCRFSGLMGKALIVDLQVQEADNE
jgi:hypothetical protein